MFHGLSENEWETITVNCNKQSKDPTKKNKTQSEESLRQLKVANNDDITPRKEISRDMKAKISQARNLKKLSQAQLALALSQNRCAVTSKDIQMYEQGKINQNPGKHNQILRAMEKILNIKLTGSS
jgi:ribosome-binding protein aMBF1 (putative translation factor)